MTTHDYSHIDFTGMSPEEVKKAKKAHRRSLRSEAKQGKAPIQPEANRATVSRMLTKGQIQEFARYLDGTLLHPRPEAFVELASTDRFRKATKDVKFQVTLTGFMDDILTAYRNEKAALDSLR